MAYTTVDNPELYFQVKLYTGDNSSSQAQTLDGSENMSPDLVWIKSRNASHKNGWTDTVRGVTKTLHSGQAGSDRDEKTLADGLTAFGANGFTVGNNDFCGAAVNYVAWCWKRGSVPAMDIVTWTGNGANRTLSHACGVKPSVMICKRRNGTDSWRMYHTSLGAEKYLTLNSTAAPVTEATIFNNTEPTSSVFTVSTDSSINSSTNTYVAWLFSDVAGFCKSGTYIGNGNAADGTFIYLGFKPSLVITKIVSINPWHMGNNKSSTSGTNVIDKSLQPNDVSPEATGNGKDVDFLSNGMKFRSSNAELNGSGVVHYYIAFAESPFVNSSGVPNNAR